MAGATPPVGVEPPSVLPAPSMAIAPPTIGLTHPTAHTMPLAPMGPVPPANLVNRPPKYFELPAALMMDQIEVQLLACALLSQSLLSLDGLLGRRQAARASASGTNCAKEVLRALARCAGGTGGSVARIPAMHT